jgi:hypothetical protein
MATYNNGLGNFTPYADTISDIDDDGPYEDSGSEPEPQMCSSARSLKVNPIDATNGIIRSSSREFNHINGACGIDIFLFFFDSEIMFN